MNGRRSVLPDLSDQVIQDESLALADFSKRVDHGHQDLHCRSAFEHRTTHPAKYNRFPARRKLQNEVKSTCSEEISSSCFQHSYSKLITFNARSFIALPKVSRRSGIAQLEWWVINFEFSCYRVPVTIDPRTLLITKSITASVASRAGDCSPHRLAASRYTIKTTKKNKAITIPTIAAYKYPRTHLVIPFVVVTLTARLIHCCCA